MRLRRMLLVSAGVLGIGLLVGLAVLRLGRHLPDSFHNPPIFPGAVALTRVEADLPDGTRFPHKISFRAPAESAAVLAFYHAALQQDGWLIQEQRATPAAFFANWHYDNKSPDMYAYTVFTEVVGPNQTVVTLLLEYLPGM